MLAGRIPELDGIRAIAIWTVVIHHLFYGFAEIPRPVAALPKAFTFVVSRGWLGVDLFFVLSGFLITGILVDSKNHPRFFRNFYIRRILRIQPIYILVVLVCWFFYAGFHAYFTISLLLLANFAHVLAPMQPHGPSVFWSLAVEEHFYLIWPFLVRFAAARFLPVILTAIILFTPPLRGYCAALGWDPGTEIYSYSFFRFDGLAMGALLAIWMRSRWQSPRNALRLAGGLAILAIVLTAAGTPFGLLGTKTVASAALRYTQVQLVFTAFLAAALALRGQPITAPLRCWFAGRSGEWSYCMYLIHLSLGDGYDALTARFSPALPFAADSLGRLLFRAVIVATTTVALAAFSKHFIEDPFLRLKDRFPA
jgi:peptidoglycan/LPS O-acetylase OafA/YrhL